MNSSSLTTQILGLIGYPNATPTQGEIRSIERAMTNGWTADQIRATAQRCALADVDNPRTYLLAALRSHATEQPRTPQRPEPEIRSRLPCPNCDGTGWQLTTPVERFGYSYPMLARCPTLHLHPHHDNTDTLTREMIDRQNSDDLNTIARAASDPKLDELLHRWPLIGRTLRYPPTRSPAEQETP